MSQNILSTKKTEKQEQIANDLKFFHEILKPGDTVYTCLKYAAASGMSRVISCYVTRENKIDGKNEIYDISWLVARLAGYRFDEKYGGVRVQGCGMDMGFAVVYTLSRVGFAAHVFGCIGEGCPSNDHSNGDRDYTPHMSESDRIGADGKLCECHKEHLHSDAGYALRQRWI